MRPIAPSFPPPRSSCARFPISPRAELKEEGLIRSIGVSNFRISDFEKLLPVAKVCLLSSLRLHHFSPS